RLVELVSGRTLGAEQSVVQRVRVIQIAVSVTGTIEVQQFEGAELVPRLRIRGLEISRLPIELQRLRVRLYERLHEQCVDGKGIERVRGPGIRQCLFRMVLLDGVIGSRYTVRRQPR